MIRVTTPQHKFTFPTDPSTYKVIKITYAQNNRVVLEKVKSDLTFGENNSATLQLTQGETKAFRANIPVQLQVRVLTAGNDVLASAEITVSVDDVLNDEVLQA